MKLHRRIHCVRLLTLGPMRGKDVRRLRRLLGMNRETLGKKLRELLPDLKLLGLNRQTHGQT